LGTVECVRATSAEYAAGYRYRRPRWRRTLVILTVITVLLVVAGVVAYNTYERFVANLLTVPGCTAGTGPDSIALDFGQASDAAVIAGVAAKLDLPAPALTIAYATAFQESKLENLSYGDRDSVGLFQQRPSQGWGSKTELEDPAYASKAFFAALVQVPHWTTIPVDQAAQDVQHSAGGYAYEQYAQSGAQLAADYTSAKAAVTCWYNPADQAASEGVAARLNLRGAEKGVTHTFGAPGQDGVVTSVTRTRSGDSDLFRASRGHSWTVANWLVTNASSYGITQVSYAGYRWTAGLKETSWQRDPGGTAGGIVAS
jgi:hypothetical protein